VSPFSIRYSSDRAEDLTAATAVERAVPIGESRERPPLLRERVQVHARSLGSSHPLVLRTPEVRKEEVDGKRSKKKEDCPCAALLAVDDEDIEPEV
jgi:hypothetical protein